MSEQALISELGRLVSEERNPRTMDIDLLPTEDVLRRKHPDRPLRANVEFYTAVLLDAVGLDRTLFSAAFACGRVAGWLGHVAEQRATGRLIRPASRYVGHMPG